MTVSSSYWIYFGMLLWTRFGEQFRAAVVWGLAEGPSVTRGSPTAARPPQRGRHCVVLCFTAGIPPLSPTTAELWRDRSGGEERTGAALGFGF